VIPTNSGRQRIERSYAVVTEGLTSESGEATIQAVKSKRLDAQTRIEKNVMGSGIEP